MHAVLLTGHGGTDRLSYRTDIPTPSPGDGEVLIEVRAAGVNNTDLNTRTGWYAGGSWTGAGVPFPLIQGADACGVVAAVGAGVDPSRVGERVIVQSCLRSRAVDGVAPWLGSDVPGAFAQFVCAPDADTHRVRCDLPDAALAAVPCSYGTAENLLAAAGVTAGERVLVTGASGGVGSAAVLLARLRGAEVVAVAGDAKAEAVAALGARVISRGGVAAALGRGTVDVAIDLVGGPEWTAVVDALRPGGRYATSGAIGGAEVALDLRTLYLRDLVLRGCTMQAAEVMPTLVRYLEAGALRPLVSATYPLAEIARAQDDFAAKRHVGKLVLIPPPPG